MHFLRNYLIYNLQRGIDKVVAQSMSGQIQFTSSLMFHDGTSNVRRGNNIICSSSSNNNESRCSLLQTHRRAWLSIQTFHHR